MELNAAMRTTDKSMLQHYLQYLGPLAYALLQISQNAEMQRKDKIESGNEMGIDKNLGTYNGSIVFYRGGVFKDEWIKEYENKKGSLINMPGKSSCTFNLKKAFDFAVRSNQ